MIYNIKGVIYNVCIVISTALDRNWLITIKFITKL